MYLNYFFLSFLLVVVILMVIVVVSFSMDKDGSFVSSYECGFDPVMESRVNFSFRFFLISILFLIFDVEISLMLPLPYLSECSLMLVSIGVFLFVLLVGLLYEYYNGVLSWVSNN